MSSLQKPYNFFLSQIITCSFYWFKVFCLCKYSGNRLQTLGSLFFSVNRFCPFVCLSSLFCWKLLRARWQCLLQRNSSCVATLCDFYSEGKCIRVCGLLSVSHCSCNASLWIVGKSLHHRQESECDFELLFLITFSIRALEFFHVSPRHLGKLKISAHRHVSCFFPARNGKEKRWWRKGKKKKILITVERRNCWPS